jgi:hypothetical protein
MTPERLVEIYKLITAWAAFTRHHEVRDATLELLTEVKYLRVELERVRGQAVASGGYAQEKGGLGE